MTDVVTKLEVNTEGIEWLERDYDAYSDPKDWETWAWKHRDAQSFYIGSDGHTHYRGVNTRRWLADLIDDHPYPPGEDSLCDICSDRIPMSYYPGMIAIDYNQADAMDDPLYL